MAVPKVREVIRRLERDGWRLVRTAGDHRQYKRPGQPGRVTVTGGLNDDVLPGTWNSIQKQAGWKTSEEPEKEEPDA